MIKKLDWDSTFFKKEIGKVIVNDLDEWNQIEKKFYNSGFDLLYVFTNTSVDHHTLDTIQSETEFHDIKLTYQLKPDHKIEKCNSIRELKVLSPELESLALRAGIYSRFNRDSKLKEMFPLFYKQWIYNSLFGDYADLVLGYHKENDKLCGMITLKKQQEQLRIGLISVGSEHSGHGIGKKLIHSAIYWAKELNLSSIIVDTQEINQEAVKFYLSSGFKLINKTHIFHKWK